jgi:hypothetical protein
MATDHGVCWVCQSAIRSHNAVSIGEDRAPAPVCWDCWQQIPPVDRVRLAAQLRYQSDLLVTLRGIFDRLGATAHLSDYQALMDPAQWTEPPGMN